MKDGGLITSCLQSDKQPESGKSFQLTGAECFLRFHFPNRIRAVASCDEVENIVIVRHEDHGVVLLEIVPMTIIIVLQSQIDLLVGGNHRNQRLSIFIKEVAHAGGVNINKVILRDAAKRPIKQ